MLRLTRTSLREGLVRAGLPTGDAARRLQGGRVGDDPGRILTDR